MDLGDRMADYIYTVLLQWGCYAGGHFTYFVFNNNNKEDF